MNLLSAGAGAGEGLEKLLARYRAEELLAMQQRGQAETIRSNKADEDLRRQTLQQQGQNTAATLAATEAEHRRVDKQQNIDNAGASLATLPMQSVVQRPQFDRFTAETGVAQPSQFEQRQSSTFQGPLETPIDLNPINAPTNPESAEITYKGSSAQQHQADVDAQKEATDKAYREATERRLTNMEQNTQIRRDFGPPMTNVANPNVPGGALVIPRTSVPPEGMAAPQTGAMRAQEIAGDVGLAEMNELKTLFKPEYVGPGQGLFNTAMQMVPFTEGNPDFVEFSAKVGQIRNKILQLRSGAQITTGEAQRLLDEIPTVNDKPENWPAKWQVAYNDMTKVTQRLAATRGAGAGAPNAGGSFYERFLNSRKPPATPGR